MTKRGGGSHGRRFSILVVSTLMLAATFLLPFSVHAEDTALSPADEESHEATVPSFTTTDEYLNRATHVSLRAPLRTKSVEFTIGDQTIQGIKEPQQDAEAPAKFEIWHPTQQPATSGVMTAHVTGHDETTPQIVLHDMLVPKAEQIGDALEVRGGAAGSFLPGTTLSLIFNGAAPQVVDCSGGCGVDALLAKLSLVDVAAGNYTVQLHFADANGDIGDTSTSVTISWPAKSELNDDTFLPVSKAETYVPKLEVVPIASLSTQFSTPVSSALAAAISGGRQLQSADDEPLAADVKGAAVLQANPLTTALQSDATAPDVPVAATETGWSVFGLSWYWWVSGAAVAWVGIVAGRWWLR